jgi:hypothetical protein
MIGIVDAAEQHRADRNDEGEDDEGQQRGDEQEGGDLRRRLAFARLFFSGTPSAVTIAVIGAPPSEAASACAIP